MIVAVVVVVALIAGVSYLVLAKDGDDGDDEAVATGEGEIFLEPAASAGPSPFTEDIAVSVPDRIDTAGSGPTTNPPSDEGDDGDATNQIEPVPGGAPGLYGGTRNNASCNAGQLKDFLASNPDKAQAWVDAMNSDSSLRWSGGTKVRVADVSAFVDELTPVVLIADTRVTNYGYSNGRPTPRQAVLERGTAVFVDQYGVPRVKCGCGNPLNQPTPVTTKTVRYTGEKWTNFSVTSVIIVQQSTTIINNYTLVNIEGGGTFDRPATTDGGEDTDVVDQPDPPEVEPPDDEEPPEVEPPDDEEPPGDFCTVLQAYVTEADTIMVEDVSDEAFLDFFERAFDDLKATAPSGDMRADLELIYDAFLQMLEDGTILDEQDPAVEAANDRLYAYAVGTCGIILDE